jgi:hypothetical protein
MRSALCLLALALAAIPSAPAARDLLRHPSASATRLLANDITSPASDHIETATTHHHLPLRIAAFPGAWGVEAVANLSAFRSSLLAKNARVFHQKEAVLEDKDEKYERFKVRGGLGGRRAAASSPVAETHACPPASVSVSPDSLPAGPRHAQLYEPQVTCPPGQPWARRLAAARARTIGRRARPGPGRHRAPPSPG